MTSSPSRPIAFRRILVKLSGEALMGEQPYGLDPAYVRRVAEELKAVHQAGCEICLVVGGGNIFRGVSVVAAGMDRLTGDHMGMLATVINALGLRSALEAIDVPTRVQSALAMNNICEPYIPARALRHLQKGRIVIFAAGTGNPYFTTDTAGALRAAEMNCDALFKATKVDGIYSADPMKNPDAVRYAELTYRDIVAQNLHVMDHAAIELAEKNDIPLVVFNLNEPGALEEVVRGQGTFTLVERDTER